MILGASGSTYFAQVISGLGSGAVLFLVASGLTLIFGAMRIVNFAHGALFTIGAYISFSISDKIGFSNATFWLVIIASGLVLAVIGCFMEVAFFRPIYGRPLLTQLLVTFAFVLIVTGVIRAVWGSEGESTFPPPFLNGGVKTFGGQAIPTYQFFYIGLAVAVAVVLWAVLYKTALGRMVRAAVSDPQLLGLSGRNVKILFTGVFALGCFFAGIAGSVYSFQGAIGPEIGVQTIIQAFIVIVLGGLGSLLGAFVASFIVGLADAIGILWVPQASLAIPFIVLVIVLAVRPQGLFGADTA